jgi:prephenate dehydrogenase
VSHLAHAAIYALTNVIGEFGELRPEVYQFGAGGSLDTTRIASSDPRMWRDIFLMNRDAVLETLEGCLEHLNDLRNLVAAGDGDGLERYFAKARAVRARMLRQS